MDKDDPMIKYTVNRFWPKYPSLNRNQHTRLTKASTKCAYVSDFDSQEVRGLLDEYTVTAPIFEQDHSIHTACTI